ncbi:cache domain-containing sensor histidine kinase [Paenibacillus macerans]|uniref:cache domain-containing sensor histidine kinase n=1 Tax=Paenibacillus macerans TaxID=44252 RepID=UPI003D31F988
MRRAPSIRNQMVRFFSVLILIPLLFSALYVYWTLQENIRQSYARHQSQATEALALEVDKWRSYYDDLSFRIFGDPVVQHYLMVEKWQRTAEHLSLRSDTRTRLITYQESSPYIRAIYLMNNYGQMTGSSVVSTASSYFTDHKADIEQRGRLPFWDNGLNGDTIVLMRQINDNRFDLTRKIGYVMIVIDQTELMNTFRNFALDEGQSFVIFDETGHIRATLTENRILPVFPKIEENNDSQYKTMAINDEVNAYFAVDVHDWHIVTWIAESDILRPVRQILPAYLFVTVTVLIFTVVMVIFVSNRITRPLLLVQKAMKQLGGGLPIIHVPVLRNDEIGHVAMTMNRMSDEILNLIEQKRAEEAKIRMLQLRTFEYQINPHFLYNALDSVNMLARKQGDRRIADIVTSLSRLLRIGLNRGNEIITVSDEVKHVEYYLRIQGIRFEEQLAWDIHIEPGIGEQRIIKFLLQPLVENSIQHGIRRQNKPGNVSIRIFRHGARLNLEVSDNGVGMCEECLLQLRREIMKDLMEPAVDIETGGGFGLWNVHQRVRLHYGPDYGVEIDSREGEGTRVTVKLPRPE